MSTGALIAIVLIVLLLGGAPFWNYSQSWGWGPAGGLGTVLVIVLILVILGKLP